MKLTHIRDILAAADCGSLRAASRRLGIGQPSISRSIREIEQELGTPLFERSQTGTYPTVAGRAFIERARAAQAELRRAKEEVAQLRGEMRGSVTIAMSAVASSALLPQALRAFRLKYPLARLRIIESLAGSVESQILDGRIDFYGGPFEPIGARPDLIIEELFENRQVVIARRGHALARMSRLADLGAADWVKQAIAEHITEADFELHFVQAGLPPPNIVLMTTSATATLLAVATTDLMTIVPQQILKVPFQEDAFDVLRVEEMMPAAPIAMVRRRQLPLTPLAEYLSDMIRRAAVAYCSGRSP